MEYHNLAPYPAPKDKFPLYGEPDEKKDNIRIYVPTDLNKDAILRRLDNVIDLYREARKGNKIEFSIDKG